MSSDDPHQGGRLEDMAATGTKLPNDAGQQNVIPSVPRPDQADPDSGKTGVDLAQAADNDTIMPSGPGDKAGSGAPATGEVVSGTGHQLPAAVEQKHSNSGGKEGKTGGSREGKAAGS